MGDHAVPSAPSSSHWIRCPPGVRFFQKYVDEVSSYALENTSAHALTEYKLKRLLGLDTRGSTEDLDSRNEEMDELTEGHASYVTEVIGGCESPAAFVEEKPDLSGYVEESFGTADCVVVGVEDLRVIDLKYGQGVLVDAKGNS